MKKSTKDLLFYAGVAGSAYALYDVITKQSAAAAAPNVNGLGDLPYDTSGYANPGPIMSDPSTGSWGGGGWGSPPAGPVDSSGGGYAQPGPIDGSGMPWEGGGDPYQGQIRKHGGHSPGHPWWRWRQRQQGYNGVQQSNYNPNAWWSGGNPFIPSPFDQSTTFGTPMPYGYGNPNYYSPADMLTDDYDAYTVEQPGSLLAASAEFD